MRGTISLDILLSFVVMLIVSSVILGISFIQLENAALVNAQFKAESLAMAGGSSINHFRAINATEGWLNITLGKVGVRSPLLGQPGWPDVFSLRLVNCSMEVTADSGNGHHIIWVNFTLHRTETNTDEYVNASYPLVAVNLANSAAGKSHVCDGHMIINHTMGVEYA